MKNKTLGKRIGAVILCLVLMLAAVFAAGRYGWKLGGFSVCESAGIEQVNVEDGHVRIRGFDPGTFPRGFLGYHAEQVDSTLYVGFRFSSLFGIFETGDFDITIPTDGKVTQVVVKSGSSEHSVWPDAESVQELPAETEPSESGICIRLEREDVSAVGWHCENKSGGMTNADGTALPAGEDLYLDDDIIWAAKNLERAVPFMLTFSDMDGNTIAQANLSYDPQMTVMNVTLTSDGTILVDGNAVEQMAVSDPYEQILAQYAAALEEGWNGQQLVDAGLNFMIRDVAPEAVGYTVDDLDDNGIPELAIGTLDGDEYYGKMIFVLYTQDSSGEPVQVFSSIERDCYYYAGGSRFANIGASGADSSFETTIKLEGEELVDMTFTTAPEDYVQMELTAFLKG